MEEEWEEEDAAPLPADVKGTPASRNGDHDHLFREVPVHRVRSRVLGEDVLWAADDAEVPDTDLVVYRASELAALDGLDPDALRKIHDVKKELDGEVHKVRTFFSDSGFARILIDGLKWTFWAMIFGSRVDEFEFV